MIRQGPQPVEQPTARDRPAARAAGHDANPLQTLFLALILSLPSAYCLLFVPPLWRDSDGFLQVFTKPSYLTLLQWPPLYCFGARVPLRLGNLFDPGSLAHFSLKQPGLTDAGTYALLLAQHALLILACLAACRTFTKRAPLRLAFATGFALSPGLYAFAQCVGSESLSHCLLIWTVVAGARLKQQPDDPHRYPAYVGTLASSILTRHINALACLLLPVQTCLHAIGQAFSPLRSGRVPVRTTLADFGRRIAASLALSIGAFLIAQGVVGLLCLSTRTAWVPRLGYTFQWRLDFLGRLPPAERHAFLDDLRRRVRDPLVADGLTAVENAFQAAQPFDPERLFQTMYDDLAEQGLQSGDARRDLIDRKLNRLAQTVLFSPDGRFWRVVTGDFLAGLNCTASEIALEPFRSTDWLKTRIGEARFVPLRGLITFRTPRETVRVWQQSAYFHLGAGVPVWSAGALALAGCLLLVLQVLTGRGRPSWPVLSFSLALLFTGAALLYANCALTFRAARFVPPAYILFLLAGMASWGAWGDRLRAGTKE